MLARSIRFLTVAALMGLTAPLFALSPQENIACSGTEPFWGLSVQNGVTKFDLLGEVDHVLGKPEYFNFSGQSAGAGFAVVSKMKSGKTYTAHVVKAAGCSDGMSERTYDSYVVMADGKSTFYYGCCTVTPLGEKVAPTAKPSPAPKAAPIKGPKKPK